MMGTMLLLLFLLSLSFAGTFARLISENLGDRCGSDDLGHLTLIDDCSTGVIDHFDRINGKVCCEKEHYLEKKRSIRKSEEACNNFGPGFRKNASQPLFVLPGEYQHNAALGYDALVIIIWGACNGVLISEYYVLSLATCSRTHESRRLAMIRLGNIDLSGDEDPVPPQDIPVDQIVIHPDYNESTAMNNILLIKLVGPAKFNEYVQPACLYTKTDTPDEIVSTGWGTMASHQSQYGDILLKSNVRPVDMGSCKDYYIGPGETSGNQPCGLTDTDICFIGAGSPLFLENGEDSRVTVVGLVSVGNGCSSSSPDVFTRISNYLNWIEEIVWP